MQSLVHSYETFSLNTVYCLLFLDLYSNASSCYFLSTCVVPLCTIRLAIMGCFARLPRRRCFCLDVHVPQTQQPLSERSLMSPSLSLSLSLYLQEPFFHNENHNGCCLIKQALISGRLKPLQLSREKRQQEKKRIKYTCMHSYAI